MNLDRGDSQGIFARAVSSDGRSYRDEVTLLCYNVPFYDLCFYVLFSCSLQQSVVKSTYEVSLVPLDCNLILLVPFLSSLLLLQLFTEAAGLLRRIGSLPMQMIEAFELLGAKARTQAQEMMDAEAMLGDIPDEFLDPIQVMGTC